MKSWLMVVLAAAALTTAGCDKKQESSTTEVAVETPAPEDETAASSDVMTAPTDATPAAAAPATPAADASSNAAPETPGADSGTSAAAATDAAPAAADKGAEVTLPGGTKYIDTQVGSGKEAARGSTVSVHYTGRLTDGTKFDSSLDSGQPFEVTIGTTPVIKGWTEGLVGMKVGGHRSLTIPPDQGYGAQGMGPIPANSTLLFDIELLDVK